MTPEYEYYLSTKKREWGEKFDPSGLDPRFIRYFRTGQRIRVKTCGMILTGTVSATTGWKPAFLLMRRSNSLGSPWTLGPQDELIAVKQGRRYYHRTTL